MSVGWISASHDPKIASFRYRTQAPIEGLRARGHRLEVYRPERADRYDVVVFSKAYGAAHRALARSVKRRGGRVVFDLCDNHFYNPFDLPKYRRAAEEIGEMMSIADQVVCSTQALADVVIEETSGEFRPVVIGDIVERVQLPRRRRRTSGDPLRLTWFGSHGSPNAPSGMTDLLLIREQLESLAARRDVELTVCSNNRVKFEQEIAPMGLPTRYVEWSLEGFPEVLAASDAAVVPMTINPFTVCKTHNRLTTALYAGVPVIASEIDSYKEFSSFCTLDNWEGGLEAVNDSVEEERQRAIASRDHIDRRWNLDLLSSQWEAALALPPATSSSNRFTDVSLHGRLDAVARTAVTGWVRAPMHPDLPIQVVLEFDGEPVSIARADQPRDDLKRAGLNSDCGFSLPLPPRLMGGAASRITVRVLDSDWVVGEDPIFIGVDESASFAPAKMSALPTRGSQVALFQHRWDVAEEMDAQERELGALTQERQHLAAARRAAARAALGLDAAGAGASS